MLRGGITCFNDMYFYPDAAAEAAIQAGIRAMLGMIVIDFPSVYASDTDDYISKGLRSRETCLDTPLITFCVAPHAPYTVSDASFRKIAVLAGQAGRTHPHSHSRNRAMKLTSHSSSTESRPLTRLHTLDIVGPQLVAVHAVHLNQVDIDLCRREGVHIAHCPSSNLKLGSGIAPLADIESAGLNFGLGTDGAASNNRLDLFQEMRQAALLAKGASGNAAAVNTHAALRSATLGGARALGLDEEIGSLKAGKAADLCAVKINDWISQPCFDPASHLVFVLGREQVNHVWVAGKQRLRDGKLIDFDLPRLIEDTRIWHTRINS